MWTSGFVVIDCARAIPAPIDFFGFVGSVPSFALSPVVVDT
jgi:hypothetical protein